MMKRREYVVVQKNPPEFAKSLQFPELGIKFSNGHVINLSVKEGEKLPVEFLDPDDVKKSIIFGSLKHYLASGQVLEVACEEMSTSKAARQAQDKKVASTSTRMEAPGIKQGVSEVDAASPSPSPNTTVPQAVSEDVPVFSDLSKVDAYDKFCVLPHVLKLKIVKETSNVELLKEISEKTDSNQIKNNAILRLSR